MFIRFSCKIFPKGIGLSVPNGADRSYHFFNNLDFKKKWKNTLSFFSDLTFGGKSRNVF